MKGLVLGLLCVLSFSINAKTIVITSDDQNDLSRFPQNLMATFVDQGFKQVEVKPNVWELSIKNLRCDRQSNDVLYPDYSNAGLPSVKCFVNAEPERNGAGTPIQESRYVNELINLLELKADGEFSDCAMGGKCTSFVSSIKCTADLNKEEMRNAYSCTLN